MQTGNRRPIRVIGRRKSTTGPIFLNTLLRNLPMSPTTTKVKNPLMAKLGADAAVAVQKHANDETKYGFINLPPGIDNGVAQLTECYFDEYKKGDNKGKVFFRAVGNVQEPYEATALTGGKMRTKGLQTSIMIGPIEDTVIKNGQRKGEVVPKEKYVEDVLNHLRMLGGEGYTNEATIDDLPDLSEALVQAAPYFKFTTSPRIAQQDGQGFKKGDVTGAWENWHGTRGLEDYVPTEVKAVGKDNTAQVTTNGRSATPTTTVTSLNGRPSPGTTGDKPSPVPDKSPFVPETCEDLDLLLLDAESGSDTNADSQNRIKELGIAAGVTEKEQTKMASWGEVVAAIKDTSGFTTTTSDEEEGLKVGMFVGFHPKSPVTKKKSKEPVRCSIVAINGDKVDLKAGKASYKNILEDDLVEDPGE